MPRRARHRDVRRHPTEPDQDPSTLAAEAAGLLPLLRAGLARTVRANDLDDTVMATIAFILDNPDSYDSARGDLLPFLLAVGRSQATLIRIKERRARDPRQLLMTSAHQPDHGPDIDVRLDALQEAETLERFLRSDPDGPHEYLISHALDQLPVATIARDKHESVSAVNYWITKSRRRLSAERPTWTAVSSATVPDGPQSPPHPPDRGMRISTFARLTSTPSWQIRLLLNQGTLVAPLTASQAANVRPSPQPAADTPVRVVPGSLISARRQLDGADAPNSGPRSLSEACRTQQQHHRTQSVPGEDGGPSNGNQRDSGGGRRVDDAGSGERGVGGTSVASR